jgi:subtilisin family serine protease
MDAVFDAQFQNMQNSFAREGTEIAVAYTPAGEVDYVYETGHLLTADVPGALGRVAELLPGVYRVDRGFAAREGGPVVLALDRVGNGNLTVPQALDLLDERLGEDNPGRHGGIPLATPVHILHITRICPADEPEVPSGYPAEAWPAPCPCPDGQASVRLGVCDTGLLADAPAQHSWLAGVTGELDPLGPVQPNGEPLIPEYTGHGTFVAGVARCMAPGAEVAVSNHFRLSGGEREDVIIEKVEQLIADFGPAVVNLSAGTYTRNNWAQLGFANFHQRYPDIALVAAAGNDSTDREFWPAAFPWAVSVGALGTDQANRAWFSNYGDWVDVYALGEGLVNAYAKGVYVYQEPPRRPAQQIFDTMARWDGTSFSTPLVAGLIAARISRTGDTGWAAAQAALARASSQVISGVGPALFPGDEV